MINLGKINRLKIIKKEADAYSLQGDSESEKIFLSNKNIPKDYSLNEEIDVFLYVDSNNKITASIQIPYASVGDFAQLQVDSIEDFGVFLDWGLEKNLFLPFAEQIFKLSPGQNCVVYIYIDKSNRIAASTRIDKFIDKTRPSYSIGEEIDALIYQETDLGFKAIVNSKYAGLIYHNDLINELEVGLKIKAYIKHIREDNKIDLSVSPIGLNGRNELAEKIIEKLNAHGGSLKITSKTSADTINSMFSVSKKKFKIAIGYLYKRKIISIEDDQIQIVK